MRILSKFKDYYDYLQKYGSDPNLVYDRKQSIINIPYMRGFYLSEYYNKISHYYDIKYLFFCGEIYQYFQYKQEIFELEDIKERNEDDYDVIRKLQLDFKKETLEFIPENIPVALIGCSSIRINTELTKLQFYRHYSPEICYQKIAQYLYSVKESKAKYSGEIMSDSVSDKDMLIAKGFDRFSFKKEKKKKK